MKSRFSAMIVLMGCMTVAGCASSSIAPAASPAPAPEPTSSPTAVAFWSSTEPGEPSLALYDDGTLGGFDGCNAFGGTYTRTGDAVEVQLGYGTMKACIGVDMWLRDATSAEINDDVLHVYDADDALIGTLTAEQ